MTTSAQRRAAVRISLLCLCLGLAVPPASAAAPPQARLVHCGGGTCLRLSGRRSHAAVAIRVAGHDLAVAGGRSWRATVPIETARGWANAHGDRLTLTLADMRTGTETADTVTMPPGALGRRVELATLMVSAH
jgi:hypothetical protein